MIKVGLELLVFENRLKRYGDSFFFVQNSISYKIDKTLKLYRNVSKTFSFTLFWTCVFYVKIYSMTNIFVFRFTECTGKCSLVHQQTYHVLSLITKKINNSICDTKREQHTQAIHSLVYQIFCNSETLHHMRYSTRDEGEWFFNILLHISPKLMWEFEFLPTKRIFW